MPHKTMTIEEQKTAFAASCLESFKVMLGNMSSASVADLFEKYGIFDCLLKTYDLLHKLERNLLLNELKRLMTQRGALSDCPQLEKATPQSGDSQLSATTARIVRIITKGTNVPTKQALIYVYHSQSFVRLESTASPLRQFTPEQIVNDYLKAELQQNPLVKAPTGYGKLNQYTDQLLAWRQQGMTYVEILAELEKIGCHTSEQNLWIFLNKHGAPEVYKKRRPRTPSRPPWNPKQ